MLKDKKLFLFDIDGTICNGNSLIPGSKELLEDISRRNGMFVFITNNSARSIEDYRIKFQNLGIETEGCNFVTASTVTVQYLKRYYSGRKVFVVGTSSFLAELQKNGIAVTEDKEADEIACVLIAYDSELTYKKIKDVCELLSTREVDYLATNPDYCCPIEFGFVPDCGAICQMIGHAVGRLPEFLGKPGTEMTRLALEQTGFSREETLIVGDRLYTDILCGLKAGIDTALVLTGEADETAAEASDYKPVYIFPSVRELHREWKSEKEVSIV